jgi:hypothetical protein
MVGIEKNKYYFTKGLKNSSIGAGPAQKWNVCFSILGVMMCSGYGIRRCAWGVLFRRGLDAPYKCVSKMHILQLICG